MINLKRAKQTSNYLLAIQDIKEQYDDQPITKAIALAAARAVNQQRNPTPEPVRQKAKMTLSEMLSDYRKSKNTEALEWLSGQDQEQEPAPESRKLYDDQRMRSIIDQASSGTKPYHVQQREEAEARARQYHRDIGKHWRDR